MLNSKFDCAYCAKLILQSYPDFFIKSMRPLKGGWDNEVIEVNKKYIFRFPKNRDFKLEKEIRALKELKGKLSMSVPDYEYIGQDNTFVGYKKIPGHPITQDYLKGMDIKSRNRLAADIARFFYEFHAALPLVIARRLLVNKEIIHWRPLVIKNKVLGRLVDENISNLLTTALKRHSEMYKHSRNLIIAYNDLHGNNLAFDRQAGRLRGVFDFSDIAIEDISREFCSLFSADEHYCLKVINNYEKLSGRKIDVRDVFIHAVITSAAILGVFIDQPKTKNYRHALNDLKVLSKLSSQYLI